MGKTRREFLAETTLGVAAGVMGVGAVAHDGAEAAGGGFDAGEEDPPQQQPAGAPPALGTGAESDNVFGSGKAGAGEAERSGIRASSKELAWQHVNVV